jgi:hypothetical protein
VCLAQVIIIATMYIFTPLNQILFRKWMKPVDGTSDNSDNEKKAEKNPETIKRKRIALVNESKTGIMTLFKRLDELILKPLLIREYEKRYVFTLHSAKNWC